MQNGVAKNEVQDDKRLVLGFDAGCFTCSDLASRIEDRVGDRLAVRNLNDPEVQAWRKEALGEDAKWAPTLFEIEDGKVKAWAGWRMGWALSKKVGPASTLQLLKIVASFRLASPITRIAPSPGSMSRSQFLKGASGTIVAATVVAGTNLLPAAPASAATNPYDVVKSTPIAAGPLRRLARKRAVNRDVKNVAGSVLSSTAKVDAVKKWGFVQRLRNGTTVVVVSYKVSNTRLIVHSYYSKSIARMARSVAQAVIFEGGRLVTNTTVKVSEGGHLWRRPKAKSSKSMSDRRRTQPLEECPPVGGGGATGPPDCATYLDTVCLLWEDDFECMLKGGGGWTSSCIGCGGTQSTSRTPVGMVAKVVFGGVLIVGCEDCRSIRDNLDGCSKCVASDTIMRVDYSRC